MLGLEIDMMALYYMAWGALGALIVGVIFLAITWIFVFPRAGNRWLTRVKNPDSTENKMIGDVGEVMIDKMYPKMMEKFEGDASRFLNAAVKNIDIDGYIEKGKQKFREEAGAFVKRLSEPPKEITTKDGETVHVFNDEQKWMWNLTATGFENILRLLPTLIGKDDKGNWIAPDELKVLSEWGEDLMVKRFTLIMNKLKGQMSGLMENMPAEVLNNPDLLSSIADGALAHIDEAKCIAILGAKDGPKLHGWLDMAPGFLKLYHMWQSYQTQGVSQGVAASSGTVARSGIQDF